MKTQNEKIRQAAKHAGIFLWQIAEKVNLNDGNFSRRLRKELPKEDREKILKIIAELKNEMRR